MAPRYNFRYVKITRGPRLRYPRASDHEAELGSLHGLSKRHPFYEVKRYSGERGREVNLFYFTGRPNQP